MPIIALFMLLLAAPALAQPVTQGQAVYEENCLDCHGPTGREGESGDIRGLSRPTILSAVRSGPGMMPTIPLTAEQVAAVTAYLAQLE